MRINYNTSAMLVNNYLANSDNALSASLQRLSSGLKINSGKDNPSGLALAKRMNAQIKGASQAKTNSSDGKNIIQIADGAMGEVAEMLQRMNELSVKASNGSLTDDDRKIIQDEVSQLVSEIDRVAVTTEFNGQKLLDGSFSRKGYADTLAVKVDNYSESVAVNKYSFSYTTDGAAVIGGSISSSTYTLALNSSNTKINGNYVEINDGKGFELSLRVDNAKDGLPGGANLDILGIGAIEIQVGANKGQTVEMGISSIRSERMQLSSLDVSTEGGARQALDTIKSALVYLSDVRSKLGAYENRLESTINSLGVTEENMTASYSNIMDVDMAEEMTKYTSLQVVTQAATSMLAQANQRPSQILQILQ